MTPSDIQTIVEEIRKLPQSERGPYEFLLVTRMIRDIAYYLILGIVAWALGRRIIMAIVISWKERRVRP
jgi:hypothetical protein